MPQVLVIPGWFQLWIFIPKPVQTNSKAGCGTMSTQKKPPVHHSCEGFVGLDADILQSVWIKVLPDAWKWNIRFVMMKLLFLQGLFLDFIIGGCFTGKSWSTNMFSALIYARAEQGMVSKCFFWWNDPSGSTTNQAVAIFWSTKHLRFQRSDLDAIESGVLKRVKEQRQVGCHSGGWFQISNTHRWLAGGFKYFVILHPYLTKWSNLASIFFRWLGSSTNFLMKIWYTRLFKLVTDILTECLQNAFSHSGRSVPLLPLWSQVGGWHWGGWHGETNGKTNGNQVEWILWEVAFLRCGEFLKTAFLVLKHKVEWFFQP